MRQSHTPYPAEFRQQLVELVRAARGPAELSREFGCSAQTITNPSAPAAIDAGKPLPGKEGLTTAEREELARLGRQVRHVLMDRDIAAKVTARFAGKNRGDIHVLRELVSSNQADFPVRALCRMLQVSPNGYYALQDRPPSPRALVDVVLTERIRTILAASDGNYGSPNTSAGSRDKDPRVGRKRIARLIRKAGIRGASRRFGTVLTPGVIQSNGPRGIWSTASSLPMGRTHCGLPT